MVKVAIVDDHRLFRTSYKSLISSFPSTSGRGSYDVIIEAENGRDLMQKIQEIDLPDVIFLDVNMPIMDGYDTIDWLQKTHPSIKVIILTMYSDSGTIIKMLKKGANAFLSKNASPEDIFGAIESVRNGGLYFTKEVNNELAKVLSKGHSKPKDNSALNEKEKEFLKLLSSELTYKEIAEKLNVSPRTVDGYRENLLTKLGYKSRVGLVLYAVDNGILEQN